MKAQRFITHLSTQKSYDRLSRWYDLFTASERGIQQQAISLLNPQPGEDILEIGSGTGHALLILAGQVGPCGTVTGIDLSGGMAKVARERIQKAGQSPNAFLTTADALYLPVRANTFDAVISTFTLELFEASEISIVLCEAWRVLKPGGRLIAASLYQPALPNRAVAIYNWFHRAFPRLVDCRPITVDQALIEAGFAIYGLKNISLWGLPAQIAAGQKPPDR